MEGSVCALLVFHMLGGMVAGLVYCTRADVYSAGRESGHFTLAFFVANPVWGALTLLKIGAWKPVVIAWFVQGMPPSPWKALSKDERGHPVAGVDRVPKR